MHQIIAWKEENWKTVIMSHYVHRSRKSVTVNAAEKTAVLLRAVQYDSYEGKKGNKGRKTKNNSEWCKTAHANLNTFQQ